MGRQPAGPQNSSCWVKGRRKALFPFRKELLAKSVQATTVNVHNRCSFTMCATYFNIGMQQCSEHRAGSTWSIGASVQRVWAISGSCVGQACDTGQGATLFEISVAGNGGNDYYDISTLFGFNLAMKVVPTNADCLVVDCGRNNVAACPEGFYPGGPDKTKVCPTGTDYDLYLCG